MKLLLKVGGAALVAAVGFGGLLAGTAAGAAAAAQDQDAAAEAVVLRWVGTTGHAWGAWLPAGASVEDWVEQAVALCGEEEFCEVNVFEGQELVTHEYPVPEANRPGPEVGPALPAQRDPARRGRGDAGRARA